VNPKLFGAIVVVGASLGASAGCRSGILSGTDQSVAAPHDLAVADLAVADAAQPLHDFAGSDLPFCCDDSQQDLSACMPIPCILI
jgi:hypothetical protein